MEPTTRTFTQKVTPAGAVVYVTAGLKGTLLLSGAFFPGHELPATIQITAVFTEPKPEPVIDPAKLATDIERTKARLAKLESLAS